MKEILKDFVDPKNTAVVVVDVQNDYCSNEGYLSKKIGLDTTPMQLAAQKIKSFLNKCKQKNLPIIFTKMTEHQDHIPENLRKKMEITHGDFFAKPGSWGHGFFEIQPAEEDIVLEKNQYDAFTNPELEKILKEKGIENLIVCGFTTGVCVDTTVRSAFTKGFNVVLPEDLTAHVKEREHHHKTSLSVLGWSFAYVMGSDEIKKIWEEII